MIQDYLLEEKLPLFWCAGCGNGIVLQAILRNIDKRGFTRENTVITTGIGCWGKADDAIDNENVRDLIKLGKRIERIDIYSRLKHGGSDLRREVKRLNSRISSVNIRYSRKGLMHLNYLVEEDEPDYGEIVKEVEALIQ